MSIHPDYRQFLDWRVTLWNADCFAALEAMDPDSVDCVVTSPPYWGLRDYGTARWEGGDPNCDHRSPTMREGRSEERAKLAGSAATNSYQLLLAHRSACGKCGAVKVDQQIGLEPTLGEHLDVMVRVFDAVKRVLKPTGTLWLNYGDCYATTPNGRSAADTKAAGGDDRTFRDKPFSTIGGILKAKDLCMVPNRLAIALQEAGWWVRSEIIWAKPNPMPSSVVDRPATAHEKIFMLTKSARYWYDADIVRQGDGSERPQRKRAEEIFKARGLTEAHRQAIRAAGISDTGKVLVTSNGAGRNTEEVRRLAAEAKTALGGYYREFLRDSSDKIKVPGGWDTGSGGHGTIHREGRGTPEYREKIRAADVVSPRHAGHINHTGIEQTPRGEGRNLRNYEPAPVAVWNIATQPFSDAHFATFPPELAERCILAGCPKGGLVLDPFGGAGTTALVALRHGRRAALIELNPEYAEMAQRRIDTEWRVPQKPKTVEYGPLFGGEAA